MVYISLLIFLDCICLQDKTAVCCLLGSVMCVLCITPLFMTHADKLYVDTFVKNVRSGVVTVVSLSYQFFCHVTLCFWVTHSHSVKSRMYV
jgi:hypothetical protein